ncbi:MAG TPA: sensor histidine kinase, partial [Clostridiaceae bacterium]|nr:sensor histidine kinase [Clostridiaceae bacterium]
SDDELNLVFNRFYKSDRSRTGHKGSGLGLYITRQMLAAHGQHISASNSPLGGARFTFTLQVAK